MKLEELVKKMKVEGKSWSEIQECITRQIGYDKEVLKRARGVYGAASSTMLYRNFRVKFPDGFSVEVFSLDKVQAIEDAKRARELWAKRQGR